jgi:hypothetical protein
VDYQLDMSVMLSLHTALRRDLEQVAQVASAGTQLGAMPGWEQFKKFLVIHHEAEDEFLWPVLLVEVTGHANQVALVEALEAEHAVIEPLLNAIDAAAVDRDHDGSLHDVVDELVTRLAEHLDHEESAGLALIDAALDAEEWQDFGRLHGQRLLGDAPIYVPWLLERADRETVAGFLAKIPQPLAAAYRDQWEPAYARLRRWEDDQPAPTNAHSD